MEPKKYKYEVALSFATEDINIAETIFNELKRLDISGYLFTEEQNGGMDIKKKTWEVYGQQSMYALMIISKDYVGKKWSGEEREIMQTVRRPDGTPYIIPLRLDLTPVEGLSNNISYWKWEGNASAIAISLYQLIRGPKASLSDHVQEKNDPVEEKEGNQKLSESIIIQNTTGPAIGSVGRDVNINGGKN